MIELVRRRLNERYESWGIFYGDVRVGTISELFGSGSKLIWSWSCGFYPGCSPGEETSGNNPTFDQARAEFERAWQRLLPKKTEADFQEWRDHNAFTEL